MELIDDLLPADLPTHIDAQALCRHLQVSRPTITAMIEDNRLPRPLKLGKRKLLWSTQAVREHLARHCG
jgi:predicted DNA-binding transcriptional regulator AlpA